MFYKLKVTEIAKNKERLKFLEETTWVTRATHSNKNECIILMTDDSDELEIPLDDVIIALRNYYNLCNESYKNVVDNND